MADTLYRVTIQKPCLSYNAGETPYFDANIAAQLIANGYATMLDALPGGAPPAAATTPVQLSDVVTDGSAGSGAAAPPQTAADQANLEAEAGVLPG